MKVLLVAALLSSCSCATMRNVVFAENSEGPGYFCTLVRKGRISMDPPLEWDNRELYCVDLNRVISPMPASEEQAPEPGAASRLPDML